MCQTWEEFKALVKNRHHGCSYPPIFYFIDERNIKYIIISLRMIESDDLIKEIPDIKPFPDNGLIMEYYLG